MKSLREFEFYLKVDLDRSANTVNSYLSDLRKLEQFLDKPLCDAEEIDLKEYIAHLRERGCKPTTVNRYINAFRRFYDYAMGDKSPAAELCTTRVPQTLPKFLTEDNVRKLIDTAFEKSSTKTQVMVILLYGLGARASELTNIKVEDIDFDEKFIRLFGKGRKERHNPIHESTLNLVRKYMDKKGIESGYLFPMQGDLTKPCTRGSVTAVIKRLANHAGIKADVGAHTMRHSYAQGLLENGCDLGTLQELMGHSDIKTTKVYARVTKAVKRRAFESFHPMSMETNQPSGTL